MTTPLKFDNVTQLKRLSAESGSPFFSRETMRWFGTMNLKLYRGVMLVGTDTGAPEDYPNHWVRMFYYADNGQMDSVMVGHYHTRAEAESAARIGTDSLKESAQ